jgi:hypothetical protein
MEKYEERERDSQNKTRIKEKRMGKEEGKYVYCATLCSEKMSFGKIGMNNNEVYTIPYKDVAAVVSDSSTKDYELTEDNAKRHEKVIKQVMEDHAVVPAEFGTLIKNETILRHLLSKAYPPTKDCLKLVDNMVELGVKAVINENIVPADAKQRRECISDILGSLKAKAKQAVTGDLFSNRLILNTSFLVNKDDIDAFSDEVARLQKKYPLLKLLYSGPWAPYNFVYIRIGAKGVEITKNR